MGVVVVILGGIYAGICTPVEASVVAVWYALFVGFFITKKLSLKEVFNAMKLANISTGTILIVVGVSTIFGRFLTMYQIPQQLAAQMMLYTTNPILILLLIAALLFFLGMFMETLATIVVLAPVFLPIIKSVGMNMVKMEQYQGFAACLSACFCIGLATFTGMPVSTTHTKTTAIMGVGAEKSIRTVKWGLAGRMVLTWVLTFPGCGLLAFAFTHLFLMFM